jgi:lysophospholipase L1-like esterase
MRLATSFAIAIALPACSGGSCRGSAPASGGVDAAAPSARFLALGDSFTIGTGSPPDASFPARLVARWHERDGACSVELVNVGVNGYTTDDLIARELPEVERFRPTFITLAIGANDIVRRRGGADVYRANLAKIFAALAPARDRGALVVVLPQPDWSRSPSAAAFGTPDQIAAQIQEFNRILAEEARSFGARWVDLVPLMEKQASERMVARDGLHPSAVAYGAWAEALAAELPPPCKPSAASPPRP